VLVATASGLFIAIPAFGAFYYLRNRAAKALHDIQDTMAGLLRKMPYDKIAGAHIGDEELYAADPEWWAGHETAEPTQA
jgi:biopolymer transport protein ExbB